MESPARSGREDMKTRPTLLRLQEAVQHGLGLVFPNVCQLCGEQRAEACDGYVCTACCHRPDGVRFVREPFCDHCGLPSEGEIIGVFQCGNCAELDLAFSHARSAVHATRVVLDVIHRYKYSHALFLEPFLTDLLLHAAVPELKDGSWHGLVPVPLHPTRLREREFNQAERLAAALSKATGIPLRTGWIERARFTGTQTTLTRSQRGENMRGAFKPRDRPNLKGLRLVVIDDVLTTGATTSACAAVLRRAGAEEVIVWTVARGT